MLNSGRDLELEVLVRGRASELRKLVQAHAALRSGRNGLLFTGTSSTSESDSMEMTGEIVGVCSTASEFGTKAAEDAPADVRRCSAPRPRGA
eukprot:scaffold6356_cov118-Isochrysis_galbana.AAC.1